ncbi:MAG: DUF2157 domain-containing protein [Thermoleophilia bacterium]|nr:DUF2157 domain-containing protein [Thermoleophilia bacterium]
MEVRTGSWVDAGLISSDQAAAIVAHEAASTESPGGRVAGMLGVIGALLVGLGVLLTVAANWESVSDAGKLAVIVVTMIAAYGAGIAADLRRAPRWMAIAGYVVGTLVFAGGVFLLGQVYNVRAHDPLGFLVIAVTASAVTLLVGSRVVGWIAGLAWFAWALHEFIWSVTGSSDDRSALVICTAGLLTGCLALVVGWLLARVEWRDTSGRLDADALGLPLRTLALLSLLTGLVVASFFWRADGFGEAFGGVTAAWVVVFVAALAASALFARLSRDAHARPIAVALTVTVVAIAASAFAPSAVVLAIVANLLLLAGGAGLLTLGLVDDRPFEYGWGVAWIITLVGARYVDVLVSLSFGGLAFVGAGMLLFGIAWAIGRSRRVWKERAG